MLSNQIEALLSDILRRQSAELHPKVAMKIDFGEKVCLMNQYPNKLSTANEELTPPEERLGDDICSSLYTCLICRKVLNLSRFANTHSRARDAAMRFDGNVAAH